MVAAPPTEQPPVPTLAATTAYIGIGANLGDAPAAVRTAFDALAALPATRLVQCSALYRSAPVGTDGPEYFNAVAAIATGLAPLELLAALQQIETAAGRTRPWRWAPRTLDLDLLFYGDEQLDLPTLTVPHPRIFERAFVLLPLAEIAPDRVGAAALAAVADQAIQRI